MSLSAHQTPVRGSSDDWLTPPDLIERFGPFDLDPCASVGQPWPTATRHLTIEDDGLSVEWAGFVWLNPPFGPLAERWLRRLAVHGDGMALVPARTETRWFVSEIWKKADGVLFLHGRPHFHFPVTGARAPFNSGAPICLVAYGRTAVERLTAVPDVGTFVTLPREPVKEGE